jgi:hypothetical protein
MLLEASAGRVAAQFIVRSKGVGGAVTNKQFPGFRASEKLGNGHHGYHDALLATMSLTLKQRGNPYCTAAHA